MKEKQSIEALVRAAFHMLLAGSIPLGFCHSGYTQTSESAIKERREAPGQTSIAEDQIQSAPIPFTEEQIRSLRETNDASKRSQSESWGKVWLHKFHWSKPDDRWSVQPSLIPLSPVSHRFGHGKNFWPDALTKQLTSEYLEQEKMGDLELMNIHADSSIQQSEETDQRNFGGPDAPPNRLEKDRLQQDTLFEFETLRPYHEWKDSVAEQTGFTFALDYYPVILKASRSLADTSDSASSGVVRLTGSWQFLGRGTDSVSTFNFLVEHRHRFSQNTPAGFAFENLGYLGAIEIPFADDGWHLTNLYFSQSWLNGDVEAVLGFLDVTDFVDVYPLTSPWTDFSNFVFSIGVATMDLPDDAALGFGAGVWLSDNLYFLAGLFDLNSDPNDPFNGFNTFVNERRFFKAAELGWTWSPKEKYYIDNVHLTAWHSDQREASGVLKDGWGLVLSYSDKIDDHWLMFARAGYSEDGGGLLQKAVSLGFAYQPNPIGAVPGSQLGFGINWGQPNSTLFGSGLRDQYAIESYFRLQVTREIAITPMIQVLFNPALNPRSDTIEVYGVRTRIAF